MYNQQYQPTRNGGITVLTAVLMIVVVGMAAFSVDVGYIVNARTELQRTADACSMAAVMRLPDESAAVAVAQEVALANAGTIGPPLDPSHIEFGIWDREAAKFITPTPTNRKPGAVRVTLYRTQNTNNPLSLFFAPVLNTKTADSTASSIAMVDQDLCGPFVGIQWVSVPGNPQTDSFDSNEGQYNAGSARDHGSLCSDGPIGIDGSPYVRG